MKICCFSSIFLGKKQQTIDAVVIICSALVKDRLTYEGLRMCACIWRSQANSESLPLLSSNLSCETRPLTKAWRLTARLAAQWLLGLPVSVHPAVFSTLCWGSELRSTCLGGRHSIDRALSLQSFWAQFYTRRLA